MRISDWSSDVCSSDLLGRHAALGAADGLAPSPPFAPWPWRWTLTMVASTMAYSMSGSSEQASKIRMKTSALTQSRSEEHTSELQSLMRISYAVFCLKKKKPHQHIQHNTIQNKSTIY